MVDNWIYPGSRIDRLPGFLKPLVLAARIRIDTFGTRAYHHQGDGICTRHNNGFLDQPEFAQAYARAVKAAGSDYGIPYRVHQALWCARSSPEGAFVELGTGRGFVMSAVMSQNSGRKAHLFDTFDSHYIAADGTQTGEVSGYYARSFEEVRDNFAEWPDVTLHRGDIFETLPAEDLGPIAFFHIDLNHATVEAFALRTCWPHVAKGGLLLLDDYAYAGHEEQYRAINQAAADLGIAILSTPTGQGIAIKV